MALASLVGWGWRAPDALREHFLARLSAHNGQRAVIGFLAPSSHGSQLCGA